MLDGGSLIHRLKWTDGSTYNSIADAYASFTVDVYGNATVVFDGYDGGPSTKDNAHQRRTRTKVTNKVDISDATKFVGKKDDFLSNDMNKHALIKLISGRLREKGCHTIQAEGDADLDIVKAAVAVSEHLVTLSCTSERLQAPVLSVRQGYTKCILHNGPETFTL